MNDGKLSLAEVGTPGPMRTDGFQGHRRFIYSLIWAEGVCFDECGC